MTDIFYIFMAVVAYTCISAGFVLQKKGIGWMGWKGERDRRFYSNLFLWLLGFVIMNGYGVPSAIALKRLPAHVVAAFAGWGIVVLVFLSYFFLKESLSGRDILFSFAIVMGICLLNLFEKQAPNPTVNTTGIILVNVLPVVVFAMGFMGGLSARIKTFVFAAASGLSGGLMVVCLGILVTRYQYRVALYFRSPYLYLYLFLALLSFVALQLACKKGPMMIIGPVQYSSNIVYPLFALYPIYGYLPRLVQVLAAGLIVYSVVAILKNRG
ncbi:MAG: hypothetical protein GY765_33415 [bacterium]|nr:hypothetical protein [bacterium]